LKTLAAPQDVLKAYRCHFPRRRSVVIRLIIGGARVGLSPTLDNRRHIGVFSARDAVSRKLKSSPHAKTSRTHAKRCAQCQLKEGWFCDQTPRALVLRVR
jgi:hypothetical protein